MNREHLFRAGFLFAGLGAGARGFDEARARLGTDGARFENAGGVDFDALACADYKRLAAGPATCADLSTMTPAELRAAWGDQAPDVVFTSPPCKGHSGLLSSDTAQTEKYQEMNSLVFKGLFLVMETWPVPPGLIVLENVPRVVSRGAQWLIQVRGLLGVYGYVFHEEAHDLRRIGDLGAHRRRYLLVARHPKLVPAYVFRPPLRAGKSCGDILTALPLPETESAGPMHRLPRLSLLNWIRLALIPPGGDWRDLPGMKSKRSDGKPQKTTTTVVGDHSPAFALDHAPRRGALGVMSAGSPAATVRGRADVRTGPAAVADERVALTHQREGRYSDQYRIRAFDEPAGTVTGCTDVQEGAPLVADPRVMDQLAPGATGTVGGKWKDRPGYISVADWEKPARSITGKASVSGGCGVGAVADPRAVAYEGRTAENAHRYAGSPGLFGVGDWQEPLPTVTGSAAVSSSNAVAAVADPRVLALGSDNPGRHENKYHVTPFDELARTICGTDEGRVGSGAPIVADPRIPLGNKGPAFNDILKVGEWHQPAPAVTGAAKPHGGAAVADPRPIGLACAGENTHHGLYHVDGWEGAARTVTSASRPGGGAGSVADPRPLGLGCTPRETSGSYGVLDPARPAYAVTGAACIDNGPWAIADERARFGNVDRVTPWTSPTGTITHAPAPSSGGAATADPRIAGGAALPPSYRPMTLDDAMAMLSRGEELPKNVVPVILSPRDGTWHRPLTDLELAALQGLPATLDGAPLQLAGKSRAKHRERIGNAVPVGAARAIAESLLRALLAAATGAWVLSSNGIWVRREDGRPVEMEVGDAA